MGVEGHFFNTHGELIAFDPSVKTSGPGALLVNSAEFLSFLHGNGYDIFWIVTGEKQFIGGGLRYGGGRLEMSGAFRIQNKEIIGELVPTFRSWE